MPEEKEDLTDTLLEECDNLLIVTPELKIKAAKDQKEHSEFVVSSERTYLIVAAVHKDNSRNSVSRISCKRGIPIGGYVYDAPSESYVYECSDYLMLGYIPVSLVLRVQGSFWQVRMPMCESVLKKFMTSLQKQELKNFKNHFKVEAGYTIEYIQMIDPN